MPLEYPLSNQSKGAIEKAQFAELNARRFKGGFSVLTAVPTYTGIEGEVVWVLTGGVYSLYGYINGGWRKVSGTDFLFNIVEDTTPQLGGDLDMNEKNLDLDAIPSSDNTGIGTISDDIAAGESIGFPDLVYLKSDGEWWKVDADAAATCQGLIGIALETKTDGQACKVLLNGFVRDDDWTWTVAGPIYASTTAGALTQTAPSGTDDIIKIIGVATHADRMYLHPEMTTVVHA